MGISYSTAKWLVGHQAILTSMSYADSLEGANKFPLRLRSPAVWPFLISQHAGYP